MDLDEVVDRNTGRPCFQLLLCQVKGFFGFPETTVHFDDRIIAFLAFACQQDVVAVQQAVFGTLRIFFAIEYNLFFFDDLTYDPPIFLRDIDEA